MNRPTIYDINCEAIAEKIVDEVIAWGAGTADEREDIVRDLAECIGDRHGVDGFGLAKALDSDGWNCDSQLVGILDGVAHLMHAAVRDHIAGWVVSENVKPQHSIGDVVVMGKNGVGFTCDIIGVDTKYAEYTLFCDAAGHVREGIGIHGWVYPFERVDA